MTLTKLELHGFKTFASKTEFRFDPGITAIVGPNGSGKSNFSDCVRWILGEQRPAALRAKRSEDLIFGGTEKRARMGMAQGFLTLDNRDGTLPIDFSEVVVGRRIFRTGESEYLLNGNRVRLRDVLELLAHAGISAGTYTVIGQGLVDAALALRPEERRQLFEDAAGLGAYQGKRDDALRRLGQTQEHLTRVRDILTELEPQVKRLRRQAERAEEAAGLDEALRELLRQWYGFRWGQAAEALSLAGAALDTGRTRLEATAREVAEVEGQVEGVRERQATLRGELAAARAARGQLREEAERLRRERAVAEERTRGWERQQAAFGQEAAVLEAEITEAQARLTGSQAEEEALQVARAAAQTALDGSRQALAEAEGRRGAIRRTLDEGRRALGRIAARQGELRQQGAALRDRQGAVTRERVAHEAALADVAARHAAQNAEVTDLTEQATALTAGRTALAEERGAQLTARHAAAAGERAARQALHETERALSELRTRRDVLARLREEGAGYAEGVRALLAHAPFAPHVVGPVADLLQVPERLAAAVSGALDEWLQAVVTREAGEEMREWLRASKKGRVALLLLPALQPPTLPRSLALEGTVGRLAELVGATDPTLLDFLLGDWLVMSDWASVARVPASSGWNLVTRDGQVRTRGGAIRWGRGAGGGSVLLAQSREWAALPEQLAAAERAQRAAKEVLDAAAAGLDRVEEALARLEREAAEAERQAQRATAALERARRAAAKLQQEQEWREGLLRKLVEEEGTLRTRVATLEREGQTLATDRAEAESRIAEGERQMEAAHPGAQREAVERARTQVAVVEEQVASSQRVRTGLEETLARLARRQAAQREQVTQLEAEATALGAAAAVLEARAAAAEAALGQSLEATRPLEAEQAHNEQRLAELEELHAARRRARQAVEEEVHTARLALQAAEERQGHLREQIESDLGMNEGDAEAAPLLPVAELVASLPKVGTLPEGLEHDVRRLRRRIGGLGAVNPNAPAEFAELDARFTFLREQSDDLERASTDLRRVGGELDRVMRDRFVTTFAAIDAAFRDFFTRLFNGGQARLELLEPDAPTTSGVEIIARPPGKRAQSISLLSGGERSLTAAALVFAILKVSPAPFCVLDEVDAMLDEANVGRFRDLLQELAAGTQFIVVTHNRGTIEAARAIYGISQTTPGVSEVISLHLDEAVRVAKQ